MSKQALEYVIKARDESKGILRKTIGDLGGFKRQASRLLSAPFRAMTSLKGLGIMSNIAMLRGLAGQFDNLVESGLRLQAVQRSFESLTGTFGDNAQRIAQGVQAASNGALTLQRSMEISNRALAAGLSVSDIKTTLDFVSKKAVTINKDVGQAIDTMITGLSRGSTLFLDDYGILVDGVEQVKREFDHIHGSGAFDSLGQAAQKAETVAAAMRDIRRQVASIGLSGRETVFMFARIKTAMSDVADKLIGALTASDGMKSFLRDASTVANSFANALGGPDQDKAFEVLKKRAKEMLGAVAVDFGKLLGHGLMYSINTIFPRLVDLWKKLISVAWDGVKKLGVFLYQVGADAIEKLVAQAKLLLARIPLFAGAFSPQELQSAEKRTRQPGPAIEAIQKLTGVEDIFAPGSFTPFENARNVWGGLVGDAKQLAGGTAAGKILEQSKDRMSHRQHWNAIYKEGRLFNEVQKLKTNPNYRKSEINRQAHERLRADYAERPWLRSAISDYEKKELLDQYRQDARKAMLDRVHKERKETSKSIIRAQNAASPNPVDIEPLLDAIDKQQASAGWGRMRMGGGMAGNPLAPTTSVIGDAARGMNQVALSLRDSVRKGVSAAKELSGVVGTI